MKLRSIKPRSAVDYLLEVTFNKLITHVPNRRLRSAWLRLAGAELSSSAVVFCGAQVLKPRGLVVGERAAIGWRVVLDARGGIKLGDDVNIASDAQILTADHDVRSAAFEERFASVSLGDYATVGARSLLLKGISIGTGGVVAAGGVVTRDVSEYTIVAGLPAKPVGTRVEELTYQIKPPPPLA